jgi:hypothetical protein
MSQTTSDAAQPTARTALGKALAVGGAALSALFLLNLSMGVFFEIPDNLPIVGNLDEAAAAAVLLACLRYLGYDLLPFKHMIAAATGGRK